MHETADGSSTGDAITLSGSNAFYVMMAGAF
jgi:hypothetical protein